MDDVPQVLFPVAMLKTEMTGAPMVLVLSVGDEASGSRSMNGSDRNISRVVFRSATSHEQDGESREL